MLTKLTKEERDKLPPADFADPDHKLYPILTQEDLDQAAGLFSRMPKGEALKSRAVEIARRRGLKVPGVWETAMSVEFSIPSDGKRDDGDHVIIPAPVLFRCGDYPDKDFSLSPEEADASVVSGFSRVDLDLEHKPTVLSGKLGHLTKVEMSASDPYLLSGEVRIPKWLDGLLGPDDRKLSAAFCRSSKRIIGCGIVRNPRVNDAAMMAAFYASEHQAPAAPAAAATPAPAVTPAPAALPAGATELDRVKAEFAQREAVLKAEVEAERKRAAEAAASNEATALGRRKEAEARIAAEAVNFADSEILALRALPKDRDALIAIYQANSRDDLANPEPIQFGAERLSRVEALKRTQRTREPYKHTTEAVAQAPGVTIMHNQAHTPQQTREGPVSEERRKELLQQTQLGRRTLERAEAQAAGKK